MLNHDMVMKSLSEVEDPELKISIVDLGLVYGVRIVDKEDQVHAEIDITLTSPDAHPLLK